MVSLEKLMILTPLQKLPKNGEYWGILIVAKGFIKLPKVQNIAQSCHTVSHKRDTSSYGECSSAGPLFLVKSKSIVGQLWTTFT